MNLVHRKEKRYNRKTRSGYDWVQSNIYNLVGDDGSGNSEQFYKEE